MVLALMLCACRRDERSAHTGSPASDSLLAAGESLYAEEQYDGARTTLGRALDASRAAADERREALVLTLLGSVAYRTGDLHEARRHGEAALDLKQRAGMAGELSRSWNLLGLVALDEGRNAEASRYFTQAIEAARLMNDTLGMARGLGNSGLAATYVGEYRRAREGYRAQRALAQAHGDSLQQANAFANEAMVHIWEGDPRPAIALLDTARTIYRGIGYDGGEQNALAQLATAFELTGNFDRAFATLDTALAVARRLGLRNQEAENLRLLAGLHATLGDYRRAINYYDDAERRMRAAGFNAQLANTLRGRAWAHLRLDNFRRAGASAAEALRLHTADGELLDQLDDLLLLAEIEARGAGLARAEPRLMQARAVAGQLNTRGTRVAVAVAEARLADLAGQPRRVLHALERAGPELSAGDVGAAWQANALAARAYARLDLLDSAAAAGRRAVSAVESVRGELASEAIRTSFVTDQADLYGDLALVLLRLGRTEEAFVVADAARSRELIRQLSAARHERSTLPRALLDADELLRRIDVLVQQLREGERPPYRERSDRAGHDNALIADLAKARNDYEALLIRAAQGTPRQAALLGARVPGLEEIRAALEPGEVLVDYLIASDRLLAFALTRDTLRVVQTPLNMAALTHRVWLLRDVWGAPGRNWRWGLEAARALHTTLITPLEDAGLLHGATRLLIVPHGILGQVPFAALVNPGTGRYLVHDRVVASLPSAASLPALRVQRGTVRRPARAEGLAPFPDALPETRREVAAFRDALPLASVKLGAAATEGAFRQALAGDGIVHVATHGVLSVRSPMFSRIELARPRAAHAADDGRLEIHELLSLSIASPLVFLSGCETGAGQERTSEAVRGSAELTLAQAFLLAGAANVVLTLWRIDDAGAAAFATRFYLSLPSLPPPEALAAAQRGMTADTAHASPYYWAGYVLSGSGTLGPRPQNAALASVLTGTDFHQESSAGRRRTP